MRFHHSCVSTIYVYHLALSSTGLEEDNITILNDVILALGHDLALGLDLGFVTTELPEDVVVVDDSLNEGLLEISVNDTSGLGSLGAVTDGPLANLIGTGGEERAEVEGLAHLDDNLGQSRLGANLLALLGGLGLSLEAGEALLEGDGEGNDGITLGVLVDPGGNRGKMLVLLADVVTLGKVDEVDDGLGSQQEERVDDLDLESCRVSRCFDDQ